MLHLLQTTLVDLLGEKNLIPLVIRYLPEWPFLLYGPTPRAIQEYRKMSAEMIEASFRFGSWVLPDFLVSRSWQEFFQLKKSQAYRLHFEENLFVLHQRQSSECVFVNSRGVKQDANQIIADQEVRQFYIQYLCSIHNHGTSHIHAIPGAHNVGFSAEISGLTWFGTRYKS